MRERGNQHIIVVAGSKKFITDCLLGARLTRPQGIFSKNKVVIVPLVIEDTMDQLLPPSPLGEKRGFGAKQETLDISMLMANEPYVARPEDKENWLPYIEVEMSDAEKQGNPNARKSGIGIVMKQDGTIIRRGVGVPEWRDAIEELVGSKTIRDNNDAYNPDNFPKLDKKK